MRRGLTLAGGALLLLLLTGSTRAEAQTVRFRFVGGHWSHGWHRGWHRYWGGPSVGFYYAPYPVYVVRGYPEPSYYVGPDYWYSNPSFGLSVNIGGGGGWHRGWHDHYYGRRVVVVHGDHFHGHFRR